ncbi:MAG: hypothetical protein M1833_000887 [Piccolia ochrophora]|nr:MAG: hypothetical protein M1833_000887 [Piccolia ochrophora]
MLSRIQRCRTLRRLNSLRSLARPASRALTTAPPTSHPALASRTCLVTGGTRGIGLAIAQRFSASGAHCILVGRNEQRLQEAVAEVEQASGREESNLVKTRGWLGDVGKWEWWDGMRQQMKDVDILVNAAGTAHSSLLVTTRAESIEEVIRTNLLGTIWGCKAVGREMVRRREGCIVNVASLLGVKGGKGSVAYAASKAGVIGLTRSLALELGPSNVRVNVVVPGYIATSMTKSMTPDARSQAVDAIPLNRFGRVDEVADAALFLATNPYANNCHLNLDGGLSAT